MIDPGNVPPVGDNETLARFILFSGHFRKSDQTVKLSAIIPPENRELSVTRHLSTTPEELLLIGRAVAASRSKNLYGQADFPVNVCLEQSLSVRSDVLIDNPNHAVIVDWPADTAAQRMIALEIASTAKFIAISDQPGA